MLRAGASVTAMKRLVLPFVLSSLVSLCTTACKGSDTKAESVSASDVDVATKGAEVVAEPTTGRGGAGMGMAMDDPQAYIYSEEAGKEALEAMTHCANPYTCDALDTLVGFGDKVSADLADLATNDKNSEVVRKVALEGLKKIKDPAVGLGLLEAEKAEEEFMVRRELFSAAGESGGEETLAAMLAYYASEDSDEHRTDMRSGIRAFDAKLVFAWASENYPESEGSQVRFADLVNDTGEVASKEKVVELIGKSTHIMAKHRLAKVAVQLGDESQLSVLIAGLKSDDQYDRSDAANFLEDVAEKIPEEQKQEVIDLVKAAKAKDAGGLTSMGYKKVLEKLGAE